MTRKVLAPFAPGAGSQQVTSGLLWQVRGCWMTKITKDIVIAIYIVDFSDRRLGKLRKHLRRLKRPSGDLGSAWVVQLFQNNTLDWMILIKASNLIQFSSWKRPSEWVCKDASSTITRRLKQALSNISLWNSDYDYIRLGFAKLEDEQVVWCQNGTNKFYDEQIVWYLAVWKDDFSQTICLSRRTSRRQYEIKSHQTDKCQAIWSSSSVKTANVFNPTIRNIIQILPKT